MSEKDERPKCGECGMRLRSVTEYHPFEACRTYRRTRSSFLTRQLVKEPAEPSKR